MKFSWKFALVLVVVFGTVLAIQKYMHNREMSRFQQYIEQSDSLRIEAECAYSKLQYTATQKTLKMELENKKLKDLIDARKEEIKEYQKIVVSQQEVIFDLQEGTVETDSTGEATVHFQGYRKPYTVDGRVWCKSGKWTLGINRDPFALECAIVRTRLGDIKRLYVSTNDSTLCITDIKYYVVPEKKGFLKNLTFHGGLSYSKANGPGILLGGGYSRYQAGVIGHQESLGLWVLRSF